MDTKKSTMEDLFVLGGAALVVCAIAQGAKAEPSAPIAPSVEVVAAETVEVVEPSIPRPGSPRVFVPLHPPERYVE